MNYLLETTTQSVRSFLHPPSLPVLWGPKRLLSLILINLTDFGSSEKLQNVSHTKHIKDMSGNCQNLQDLFKRLNLETNFMV